MRCGRCGAEIKRTDKFCQACGSPVNKLSKAMRFLGAIGNLAIDSAISTANREMRSKKFSKETREDFGQIKDGLQDIKEKLNAMPMKENFQYSFEKPEYEEYENNHENDTQELSSSYDSRREPEIQSTQIQRNKVVKPRARNGAKDRVNISTLGHVTHGKTTLTKAIIKVLAARNMGDASVALANIAKASEMNADGSKWSESCVEYETEYRHYAHVDCPTHADYVKSMIIGKVQMDGAILVVAATDGVMAQTREHIILSCQIGVPYIVVFMNKCDAVEDEELLELVEMEIRELLNEYEFPGDNTPIIQGSALMALEDPNGPWGDKIMELVDAVDSYIPDPVRDTDKPFLMPVEDIFTITGCGTVVTGRVERGVLCLDDEVEIVGMGKETRRTVVIGIEEFRKLIDCAQAGDNMGILLKLSKRV